MRDHVIEFKKSLDTFMNDKQHQHLYVSGPPGSGKTTYCLFYFTQYLLADENRKGLLVQYRPSNAHEVMILENKQIGSG